MTCPRKYDVDFWNKVKVRKADGPLSGAEVPFLVPERRSHMGSQVPPVSRLFHWTDLACEFRPRSFHCPLAHRSEAVCLPLVWTMAYCHPRGSGRVEAPATVPTRNGQEEKW